jgi:hypothetical protein
MSYIEHGPSTLETPTFILIYIIKMELLDEPVFGSGT